MEGASSNTFENNDVCVGWMYLMMLQIRYFTRLDVENAHVGMHRFEFFLHLRTIRILEKQVSLSSCEKRKFSVRNASSNRNI